jgi:hypothetical protein
MKAKTNGVHRGNFSLRHFSPRPETDSAVNQSYKSFAIIILIKALLIPPRRSGIPHLPTYESKGQS